MLNSFRATLIMFAFLVLPYGAAADLRIEKVAGGFVEPWAIAFLPDGGWLVTERGGNLNHVTEGGVRNAVAGLPAIHVEGQGGLLDVVVARDFQTTRTVFFSFTSGTRAGSGTVLASARLSADGRRLEDMRELFRMKTPSKGGRHYGGRIVEASDGALFLSLGERGDMDEAQNVGSHNGSIVRVSRSSGPMPGNPGLGGLPEIWSWGHRNPQGLALDGQGRLIAVEHGARGGDEVNVIRKGANYGWPVISYGRHYSGAKIGVGTSKSGLEQPAFYWDPSIAPSGVAILSGRGIPDWKGNLLVGSLKFDMISRLEWQNGRLVEVERIASRETRRVRDIREAPDGSVWFLSVDNGAVYRMVPFD
jgi:glucose/arabinose dehydrogenase